MLAFILALLRLCVPPVRQFSPADETTYLLQATHPGTIRDQADEFLCSPWRWVFPSPLRWGYIALARALRIRTHAGLALLSRVAGAACILLAPGPVLLVATSPLCIIAGRRALQDTCSAATVLLCLHLHGAWLAVGVTVMLSVKEATVLAIPALLAASFCGENVQWMFAGVALWFVSSVLIFGYRRFVTMARIVREHAARHLYARQYMGGPPWRGLLDLFMVSPLAVIGGLVGLSPNMRWFCGAYLLVHGFAPAQNVRSLLPVDVVLRVGAAAWLGRWAWPVAAIDMWTAYRLRNVYDPVTSELTKALRMSP